MKFLEHHTKMNMDPLRIVMKNSATNNATLRVTSCIEPHDLMNTIKEVDFKIFCKMFVNFSIFANPLRVISPTKSVKKLKKLNPRRASMSFKRSIWMKKMTPRMRKKMARPKKQPVIIRRKLVI